MKSKKENQKVEKGKPEIKKTVKNERVILWQDTPKIEELKNKLNELLPFSDKVVKAYHNLPFADDKAGFYDIIANTNERAKVYLKGTLPDKVEISGLSVNKAKVLQMGLIEVDGMAEFMRDQEAFLSAGGMNYQQYFKHEGKAIVIDSIVFSKFEALNTIAAINPAEIDLHNKWLHFLTTINEFATLMKKEHGIMILPVPLGPVIIGLIARLDKENKLIINKDAFQMIAKKLRNKE